LSGTGWYWKFFMTTSVVECRDSTAEDDFGDAAG